MHSAKIIGNQKFQVQINTANFEKKKQMKENYISIVMNQYQNVWQTKANKYFVTCQLYRRTADLSSDLLNQRFQ